jgi:hypothetical protein
MKNDEMTPEEIFKRVPRIGAKLAHRLVEELLLPRWKDWSRLFMTAVCNSWKALAPNV